MPELPLLIFPEPTHSERTRRQGFFPRIRLPLAREQADRLAPQFRELQQAMDRRRLLLQENAVGIQPEQVLVLETVGSIDSFVNAIRRIDGLEWLGEFERRDIEPEHGFEDESNATRLLDGQLFLIMTNQRALAEMQSLFNTWRREPSTPFPYGLARLRDAFRYLQNIRPWNAEDRIRETGLLEDWSFRLGTDDSDVPFEAELWFRSSPERRRQSEAYVRDLVESLDGELLQQSVIPEISYHSVLGMLPRLQVQQIVEQPATRNNIRLLQCDDIMHIRPVGQCAIAAEDDWIGEDQLEEVLSESPSKDPLVALFDGMPLAGHQRLGGRLIVDDPDNFENAYQASERVHGTAMSSLICLGDLNLKGKPIDRRLYVRPIMKPYRRFDGKFFEAIPSDVLPIDLFYRSIRRLYEWENSEPPAAPTVRVINLSICDPARPFDSGMSPWARLLDWLSYKYNILFVVSIGNQSESISLDIPQLHLHSLTSEELSAAVVQAVSRDTRKRRLLSPSETINGITVGAVHSDASTASLGHLIDPFPQKDLPSVLNGHGPGHRRAIKPDVLMPGGRQMLSERLGNTHLNSVLEIADTTAPPGQLVATPGAQGELTRTRHTRGTSNATANVSRATHFVADTLDELFKDTGQTLNREYETVVLKSLLVHGATWDLSYPTYWDVLRTPQNGRGFKDYVSRFLGYGETKIDRVLYCTEQRATAIGIGSLADGEGDEFRFPLPPSLASKSARRRLTATLAWLTPVNNNRQAYRVAHLWFNPTEHNALAPNRLYANDRAVQRGTLQHEILEGDRAIPFQDGDAVTIKVNCRADGGAILDPIPYCLVVSLEVAEGIDIPIYDEVRDRLAVRVAVRGVATP